LWLSHGDAADPLYILRHPGTEYRANEIGGKSARRKQTFSQNGTAALWQYAEHHEK